ncbi:abnormal spindle-like microcephaly-associated protein [Cololabis saira]|uniref:abnormal spindle-like microcephaly-associated protein n=1 Tax=Cololabis saira TaxID=129043 RepID=UPI002AD46EB3|nr:abnormal spindle-like microcephaly-associated protein [Cololabis saira]
MAEVGPAAQRGFLDISPGRRALSPGRRTSISPGKENQVPVLSLLQFSKPPFVTFGTVKLGSSRSAVLQIDNPTEEVEAEVSVDKINSSKGFSVDQRSFTIQPQGSFLLTVTWTPTEEGRARELILFSANGVLKHQAVVLGRAEGPRRKKKSLWDAIKAKKGEKTTVSSARKKEPPLKPAANKTFAVSRAAQYRRDQARSPLAALGAGPRNRARPGPADPGQNRRPQEPKQRPQEPGPQAPRAPQAQNSPLVLLVPAAALQDPAEKPEGLQLLNRTLSPIGTPETFRRLMPHIRTPGLEPTTPGLEPTTPGLEPTTPGLEPTTPGLEPTTPGLTMRDALLLINSDLSLVRTSPGEPGQSCGFSGSLESRTGPQRDSGTGPGPTGPGLMAESSGQRHTFLLVPPEDEVPGKKKSFTSATVTKSKAPAAPLNPSSGRKVKKSRRRLMEKTLELCEGSSPDSGPATPDLPVIDAGGPQVPAFTSSPTPNPVIFPVSPPSSSVSPLSPRLHIAPPPGSVSQQPQAAPAPPPGSVSQQPQAAPAPPPGSVSQQPQTAPAPPRREEGSFPFRSAMKSKKRKSEEFLKSDSKVEDSGKPEEVKRSRGGAGGPERSRGGAGGPERSRGGAGRPERSRGGAGRPDPPRFQESKAPRAGSARSVTSSSSLKTRRSAAPTPGQRPSPRAAARGSSSVRASGCRRVKITKVVAVAQSKLTFVRPAQTALPRHPTPFAAKNMFYDERWMEKQERGFTRWLNYVLTPDDFKVNTEVAKVSAVSVAMGNDEAFSVPKAPTKEEMSFSTYTARRKLNRLRRGACQLFSSDAMATAIQRLELEVEARRLLVRTDRHLWKDIGERKKVLGWLVSYNPLWLRIGLETIFGELISLESNSDAVGLAVFILQRLLWNPDIAAQFRHPRVPNLYRDGHEEALSRFTLKKLLLLVCFLDKAKESRLIQHDPCLFCVDAEFKASRELLLAFSRDFLSGEGILPRHLAYLGLPVSHVQTPLDEFSFAVHNLAVDLRDGIRLVRVTELLVQDWTLSSRLRLPAISRLQKIHNVELALQVLRSRGVDLSDDHGSVLDSRDVVDGHREKTLSLLWRIIFTFQVEVILDEAQLRDEVCFLNRTLRTRRRLESLRADRGPPRADRAPPGAGSPPYRHPSTKLALLMDWVRAVCDFYSLKVENFTVSFSDGRVLCYLLHHYHPGLVPEASVRRLTTQTVECSPAGRLELSREDGDSDGDSDGSFHASPAGPDSPSLKFKELLENEKSNFRLVNSAVSFLGGVPAMMNPADMCNTIPSERVVMSYLSFLCARLLDLRNETRAARLIQDAWRKYRLRKDLQLYQQRTEAAVKIQQVVRRFLQRRWAERRSRAAALIQAAWREYRHRNRLRLEKEAQVRALQRRAATVIQARWRMFSSWKSYHRLRYYTVVVQAQWRMRRAAAAYGRILHAAAVLQQHVRARALSRRDRGRFLLLRAAALKLQTAFRRRRALRTQKENGAARVIQAAFRRWSETRRAQRDSAAARIQAWYRMQVCSRQYQKLRRSTLHIQALCRGHAQRRRLQAWKQQQRAAVVLQSCFRGFSVRKQLTRRRRAAASIQRWFRASVSRDVQRREFLRVRRAAVLVQAAYRGKVTRESLKKQHGAATVIQTAFRRRAAQKKYLCLRKAATLVQRRFRATTLAHKTREEYDALRNAALVLQAAWRGRAARKTVETWHQGATLIQAHYRRYKLQTEYRSKRAAAVVLQHHYRASAAAREDREAYLHKKAACVALQAAFRGRKVRTELQKKHQAATLLQSKVRMFVCRRRYLLLQSAAVTIQQRYRALVLCRGRQHQFRELRQAAVKLQAVFRGLRVRRDLKRRTDAATAIQAQFRMYKVRMSYLATKCAAVIVQERYRANKLRELQTQRYGAMKRAAVLLQAAYRGHVARRRLAETHRAAAVIQRKFLSVAARRRFLAVKAAALVCQRRYRALTLARKHRRDYLARRRAAVCLQAAYRGHAVRKQLQVRHTAAVAIQAHFRSYRQRARYQRWKQQQRAAVVLQSCFRGFSVRRQLTRRRRAAASIQRWFRASVSRDVQRREFLRVRRAAVVVQAAYRGKVTRESLKKQHRAATVVQAAFRRRAAQKKYLCLRKAATLVQRRFRATTLAHRTKEEYDALRNAALVLQAAWRGRAARKTVETWHQGATLIQAHYRRYKLQTEYRSKRAAAVVLQHHYRASAAAREDREAYLHKKAACVALQAAFRGMKVRTELQKKHQAATLLQSKVRMFVCRRRYLLLQSAAVTIQQRYRALVLCRGRQHQFRELRQAAVKLQAVFRGLRVRRDLKRRTDAATAIQAQFRMYKVRMSYLATKCAAVIVQERYRANKLRELQTQRYGAMKRAAVVLQAAYRGHVARRRLAETHRAAAVIQRKFLSVAARRRFLAVKAAALVCQRRYRALTLARKHRRDYLARRRAAVCLQAAYRGHAVRKQLQVRHTAAVAIQAQFRSYRQRAQYQRWKLQQQRAAVVLQSCFRGFSVRKQLARRRRAAASIQRWFRASVSRDVQRTEFLRVRRAAVLVQAAYRGKVTRECLKKQHGAATVIQAAFRRRAAQKKYLCLRKAATLVQRRFRATTLAHKTREEYDALRNAALVVQAAWRGRTARKTVETWHQGATLIQAHYRRYKLQTEYRSKRAAAVVLQHHYRASAAAREDREAYLHKKAACVALQAAFRGMKVRTELQKKHQAATLLQSKVRMFVCRRRYLLLQSAAVTIQQRYRALVLCRGRQDQFRELQQAAVKLQAVFRGLRVRRDLKRRTDAATAIQAQFRMYKVRMSYLATKCAAVIVQERYRANKLRELQTQRYGAMRRAAVLLQAAYRGHVSRRRLAETHRAAAVIQRKFLSVAARRRFLAVKAAALVCQRRYRALTLARKHRRDYLARRRAAVCLQAAYRGHAVRKQLQVRHTAAVAIQAQFRSYRQRARYQRLRWACSTLQERYRARKDARTAAHALIAKRKAASVIQAAYRGMTSRRLIQRRHRAAGVIQRAYRAHRQRQQFLKLKSSAVTVQQKYRATTAARAARSDYARAKRAAVTLQRGCRAWRSRRQVLEAARTENRLRFTSAVFHHLAAVKIQRALRAHWALKSAKTQIHSVISIQRWVRARRERRRYLEYKTKVVAAQRAVRRWRARRHEAAAVIQRAVRKFLLLRRQQRVERGIVKAQALWRGHRSRRLNDNPKTVKLRRRLHRVSAEVKDDDKLCNKTASALGFLLRYKHFSYILEALKNLEIATRLLPECCERLVDSGATNVIFTLIRSCNRSVPCMDVITYSIQILLNLSKYHKTVEAVYAVENSVETLLDLLQRYREKAGDKVAEKGGSIFTKACFLLALLVQDRRRAQEVKQLPKALERLRSIYRLTGRKHKMDAERSVIKQKQNASVNGSFFVPATPRKSRPPPKFAPDWVLRKDKFRDIVDPLRAIQMLAETLGV